MLLNVFIRLRLELCKLRVLKPENETGSLLKDLCVSYWNKALALNNYNERERSMIRAFVDGINDV